MQAWAIENLPDADRKAFTADVNNANVSKFAIKGMYAEFERAREDGSVTPRISGQPAHVGITPYADRRELYKDKDYIESASGRNDTAARKRYQDRLRLTSNEVLGLS